MTPVTELGALLRDMEPRLDPRLYAYAALPADEPAWPDYAIACFQEEEGRSVIAPRDVLTANGLVACFACRRITLSVHSALEAVGLTARIAQALTEAGISTNVVAALHHDHVFIPEDQAEAALLTLIAVSDQAKA